MAISSTQMNYRYNIYYLSLKSANVQFLGFRIIFQYGFLIIQQGSLKGFLDLKSNQLSDD